MLPRIFMKCTVTDVELAISFEYAHLGGSSLPAIVSYLKRSLSAVVDPNTTSMIMQY